MGQGSSTGSHDLERTSPSGAARRSSSNDTSVPRPPRSSAINTVRASVPVPAESPVVFGSPLVSPYNTAKPAEPVRQKPTFVPTVFRWAHGGQNVYITGTFNGWKERIPLSRSHEEFTAIIDLPPGTHQYKFIVDDEWRCNPDQPTDPDRSGAVNNVVQVTDTDAFDFEDFISTPVAMSPPGAYDNQIPKLDPVTKPPPVLPPHLMQVLLNTDPISETDPTLLPIPNHVMLNHLYALSISDGVMVLGVTNRYQNKYVTTVLYRPVFDDE
eukprot:comp23083_c0_seq1/m.37042 comp23083_c0_seq1/g.37042  ORF comp23083_c0_seq1/g.37042 comp23083_c0_seq1/m.37042 type:complete len:269 (-) comp23083_c0_seq1:406-1212(-)